MSVTTNSQRLDALAYANQVRNANADLKRWVYMKNEPELSSRAAKVLSRRRAADVLTGLHTRPGSGRMKVIQLLMAVRGFGDVRAHALMNQAHVSSLRRLEDLTNRQVGVLVDALIADAQRLEEE